MRTIRRNKGYVNARFLMFAGGGLGNSQHHLCSRDVVCAHAGFMSKKERFCIAYWDWLRRIRTDEPKPADYGLAPWTGEALAHKCHGEFESRKVDQVLSSLAA
jgi:hypothetical protein